MEIADIILEAKKEVEMFREKNPDGVVIIR